MHFSSRRQPNTQRTVAIAVCALLSLVIFLFVGYRLLASPASHASHLSSAHQQRQHPPPPPPPPHQATVTAAPTPPPVIAMAISEADKELLVETDSKASNAPAGADHSAVKNPDPTYEWQLFTSDSSFPPGLEFRLALDGSDRKEVRIPHTWRIQLNIGQDYHLFRADIERTTKMAALRALIAEHAEVELARVALFRPVERAVSQEFGRHFPHTKRKLVQLADSETSESCRLFFWQHELSVTIKPLEEKAAAA